MEWYEDVIPYLKTNCSVRIWFLEKRFLNIPNLFTEFLLECPAPDVRMAFCKFVVLLAHYALIDKVEAPKGTMFLLSRWCLTFCSLRTSDFGESFYLCQPNNEHIDSSFEERNS